MATTNQIKEALTALALQETLNYSQTARDFNVNCIRLSCRH